MVDIYYGRAGSGKTFSLMNEIKAETQNGRNVILIVPEQLSLTREFLVNSDGIKNVSVLSFTRFANTVFRELGGTAKKNPDHAMQTAALFLAIENVYDRLVYFKSTAFTDGFITALISAFSEFDTNCMSAEAIMAIPEAEWSNVAKNKYHDMFLIYSEYKKMWSDEYKDPSGDIAEAVRRLTENYIYSDTVFAFDGFFGFTERQLSLINLIVRKSPRCIFAFTTDMESEIFTTVTDEVNKLKRECIKQGVKTDLHFVGDENFKAKSEALAVAEQNGFDFCVKASDKAYDGITVYGAKNINEELSFIASKIKNDVLDKKYRYRDIAVICPSAEEIHFLVSSVFEKHGIPAFIDTDRTFASQPLCAFVTSALDIARFGFEPQYVFRFLKTGIAGIELDDISLLERYVRVWKLRGRHWNDEPWEKDPDGVKSFDKPLDTARLDKINSIRFEIQKPLEKFKKSVGGTNNVADILCAIYKLTEDFKVFKNIEKIADRFLARGDTMLYSEYTRVYAVFVDLLDSIYEMCHDRKMNIKRFCDMFLVCASKCSVSTRPSNIDEVEFLSLGQARAEAKKCVYIPHLNSKYLPSSPSSSSLITDSDKQVFSQHDIAVSMDSVTRSAREYFDFYCAVTTPTDELCLSYSTFAVTGEKQPVSRYLETLMKAVGVKALCESSFDVKFWLDSVQGAGDYSIKTGDSEISDAVFEINGYKKLEKSETALLSDEVVDLVYGRQMRLSFSGMEEFVKCPFKFFMNRGMRAQKVEPFDFKPNDVGTFIHKGIEMLLSQGYDISTPEKIESAVTQISEEYFIDKLSGKKGDNRRLDYIFENVKNVLLSACNNVVSEINNSDFVPTDFELDIADISPSYTLENGRTLTVSGSIDRVDMTDDKLIKIIDYKSGSQLFSYKNMFNGLSLQLPVYASALRHRYSDAQIAAMYYLKVGAPKVEHLGSKGTSDEKYKEKLEAFYKRDGVIGTQENLVYRLDRTGKMFKKIDPDRVLEPEKMDRLIDFAVGKVVATAQSISDGNIDALPICDSDSDIDSCKYCDYKSVCGFTGSDREPRTLEDLPENFLED